MGGRHLPGQYRTLALNRGATRRDGREGGGEGLAGSKRIGPFQPGDVPWQRLPSISTRPRSRAPTRSTYPAVAISDGSRPNGIRVPTTRNSCPSTISMRAFDAALTVRAHASSKAATSASRRAWTMPSASASSFPAKPSRSPPPTGRSVNCRASWALPPPICATFPPRSPASISSMASLAIAASR